MQPRSTTSPSRERSGPWRPAAARATLFFLLVLMAAVLFDVPALASPTRCGHEGRGPGNRGGGVRAHGAGLVLPEREELPVEKLGAMGRSDPAMLDAILRGLRSRIEPSRERMSPARETAREILRQMEEERSIMARTPSLCPANGRFTSRYGWRESPLTGLREFHKGVDIASRDSTPVRAPADGVVIFSGRNRSFGYVMEIDHGYGVVTRYGHLHKPAVKSGRLVKRGQKIAYMGDSGRSTGTHLHYEIMLDGVNVNPQRYMLK